MSGWKIPAYRSSWKNRFGIIEPTGSDQPLVWLHAVSVGEVEASVPLVNKLLAELPGHQFLLTTVTPTGASIVKQRFTERVLHRYLPYDLPVFVKSFIDTGNPVICIIMETEIWPNLFYCCQRADIPIAIVNARLSASSFNGYRKVKKLFSETVNRTNLLVAQTEQDRKRLIELGCDTEKITVLPNMKFDLEISDQYIKEAENRRLEIFGSRPVWLAASTHEGEEEIILNAHELIRKTCTDCLLILVPRHPERSDTVLALCESKGFSVIKWSQKIPCEEMSSVFLVDTVGKLKSFYPCADMAFVGGSLVKHGGQNLLEPVVMGVPVLSGPHVDNFREIAELLQQAGGLIMIKDGKDLSDGIIDLFANEVDRKSMSLNAMRVVEERRGSIDIISEKLMGLLK